MWIESELTQEVLDQFPAWTFWAAPVASILGAGVLSFVYCSIWEWGALKFADVNQEDHWTERARKLAPVSGSVNGTFLLCAILVTLGPLRLHGPLTPLNLGFSCALAALFALVGAMLGMGRYERLVYGKQATLAARCRWLAAVFMLLRPGFGLLLVMLIAIPRTLGPGVAFVLGAGMLASLGAARGLHFRVLSWLGLIRPADDELNGLVAEVARELKCPLPNSYELRVPQANAAVVQMANSLFVTTPLLSFPREEVRAVLAHEFGHLLEARSTIWLRELGTWNLLLLSLFVPVGGAFGFVVALSMCSLLLFVAFGFQRRVLRLERAADLVAKDHEGGQGTYARALERLHEHNLIPAASGAKAITHPHLYDRMEAAGVTPDYPRPANPSARRVSATRLASLLPQLAIVGIGFALYSNLLMRPWAGKGGEQMAVALSGGRTYPILAMAELRVREGNVPAALTLARYAHLQGADYSLPFRIATLYERTGQWEPALEALLECRELEGRSDEPSMAMDRGLAFVRLGALGLATEELDQGRQLIRSGAFDRQPWVHVQFSFLALDLGRVEEAEEALERARVLGVMSGYSDRMERYIEKMIQERAQ